MQRQESSHVSPQHTGEPRPEHLEIPAAAAGRSWWGVVGFVLLFLVVVVALVVLFIQFTASVRLAVGLVLFLVSYMVLMGWWAGRNIEGR